MNQKENKIKNKYWVLLFIFAVLTLLVWVLVFESIPKNTVTVSFLDVGQGDAIFISTQHGNQILIDGGPPSNKVSRELRNFMPFYDRHIDVVIATHPDVDHIGGLIDVINNFQIGLFIDSGLDSTSRGFLQKEKLLKNKNIQTINGRRGMRIIADDGVFMDILFPDRGVEGLASNDASIVARLVYGESEFLFTGDSPQKIEKYIVSLDGSSIESDVLKVGHHGSKTSTSNEFLSAVNPKFGVISADKNNRYGHPSPQVLDKLSNRGIKILNTQTLGTITFVTDGRSLKIK